MGQAGSPSAAPASPTALCPSRPLGAGVCAPAAAAAPHREMLSHRVSGAEGREGKALPSEEGARRHPGTLAGGGTSQNGNKKPKHQRFLQQNSHSERVNLTVKPGQGLNAAFIPNARKHVQVRELGFGFPCPGTCCSAPAPPAAAATGGAGAEQHVPASGQHHEHPT